MVVLCKQNILLLVVAERFNITTNSPRVGVGTSPAGLCARLRKLDSSERTYKTSPSALNFEG
ncbi:hypothetical protein K443DRAFT_687252, partial [Laccaria amethystina LaAM-08-1]